MLINLRRSESGLTTLEWLLIVAAVAGLAALAVVLVQNVVDDTAEQIAGNNARITAAQVAAKAITDNADDSDADKRSACNRLSITYSDAFGGDSERTSLWTDNDTKTKGGGVCAIVTESFSNALDGAGGKTACDALDAEASSYSLADRGGRNVEWADPDGGGTEDTCVLSPS